MTVIDSFSYLLFTGAGKKQRTYIGATNDPDRRLRQHNGEISGGARATKGKGWVRAVYVGGFPDWTAALQFEWAWKRHSRNKHGLEGKLKGLISLLGTDRSTKTAIPFHLWPRRFFLCFNPDCRQMLEKIEAYKLLMAMIVPPFLPTFLSITMSSTITSVDVQALSAQVELLAASQQELMNKVNALTALIDARAPEKKPRAKKAAKTDVEAGDAAVSDAVASDAEKPKKKRGPNKKDASPTGDAPTEAAGDAVASDAEKPKKKRGPNKKKDASSGDATADAAPDAAPAEAAADTAASDAEKPKKKRGPNKKKDASSGEATADAAPDAATAEAAADAAASDAEKPKKKRGPNKKKDATSPEPPASSDASVPSEPAAVAPEAVAE